MVVIPYKIPKPVYSSPKIVPANKPPPKLTLSFLMGMDTFAVNQTGVTPPPKRKIGTIPPPIDI